MDGRKIFLSFLVLCLSLYVTECGRGFSRGGGSRGRSGGSSWSRGWGSSGSSWSKPSYKPSHTSSSGSSWSWNTGSSSAGSHKYPSSSSGLSGTGSGSHSYPSSSTGLSGSGSGSHGYPSSSTGLSGSGSRSNPSSSTGLSGSGYGSHGYPSSGTGLSGSGSHSYPSVSPGLFGTGTRPHGYPSSSTGLSGSGSGSGSHGYPSSSTGLSGSGSRYPTYSGSSFGTSGHSYPPSVGISRSSSSGSHSYPASPGMSGSRPSSGSHYPSSGSGHNHPINMGKPSYSTNTGIYSNNYKPYDTIHPHYGNPGYGTYHSRPSHVYITEYRDSGSRYGDILTGLALYNMGRSHSHHHDYYYHDDYYRHRYYSSNNNQHTPSQQRDEALCTLRVKEDGKLSELKIPCEIVSTFADGSKKVENEKITKKECTTNVTIVKVPIANPNVTLNNVTESSTVRTTEDPLNDFLNYGYTGSVNSADLMANLDKLTAAMNKRLGLDSSEDNKSLNVTTERSNVTTIFNATSTTTPIPELNNGTSGNISDSLTVIGKSNGPSVNNVTDTSTTTSKPPLSNATSSNVTITSTTVQGSDTVYNSTVITPTEKITNITTCHETLLNTAKDPLAVKGEPVKVSNNMECSVDIKTKDTHLRHNVDCKELMKYSKMPEPKKESPMMPSRQTLKSWLNKPPWWMSIFIST